jgi:DNA invertase Pin-like site-specific DNA recombinase
MLIGYARVSILDKNPNFQEDALKAAGCEKIFTDKISRTVSVRPNLEKVKEILRKEDTLEIRPFSEVSERLDTMGRIPSK